MHLGQLADDEAVSVRIRRSRRRRRFRASRRTRRAQLGHRARSGRRGAQERAGAEVAHREAFRRFPDGARLVGASQDLRGLLQRRERRHRAVVRRRRQGDRRPDDPLGTRLRRRAALSLRRRREALAPLQRRRGHPYQPGAHRRASPDPLLRRRSQPSLREPGRLRRGLRAEQGRHGRRKARRLEHPEPGQRPQARRQLQHRAAPLAGGARSARLRRLARSPRRGRQRLRPLALPHHRPRTPARGEDRSSPVVADGALSLRRRAGRA